MNNSKRNSINLKECYFVLPGTKAFSVYMRYLDTTKKEFIERKLDNNY